MRVSRIVLLLGLLLLCSISVVQAQETDFTPHLDELTILAPNPLALPTPREDNAYLQELESRLGLQLNFNWVPSADFAAILNTTLASGDLPDVIAIVNYSPAMVDAIQAGAFLSVEDLGLPEETDGLPGLELMKGGLPWQTSALNGVNYGIPQSLATFQVAGSIRGDWMEAVGTPDDPKNTDELRDLLVAFAQNDPDGNGQNDTYGYCITTAADRFIQGGWGLFMQAFGVPNRWRVEPDGTLINADVTPEMRATLAYMRDLYAEGVFSPDFAALPFAEVRNQFMGNQCGGLFGNLVAIPDSPQYGAGLRAIVPDAEIHFLVPPAAEGFDPVLWLTPGWERIMFLNARFASDPEAAHDVLKVIDYFLDPANEEFIVYGIEGVHHTVSEDGTLVVTDKGTADISWIRAWGPRTIAEYPYANYVKPETYQRTVNFTDAHRDIMIASPTWGLWPDLGLDNPEPVLNELAATTFDRIVRGDLPLEAFDTFVEDWYAQGGQALTDAYTAAYQTANP